MAGLTDVLASLRQAQQQNSATRTRARVAQVRAEDPNQLNYSGSALHALLDALFSSCFSGTCVAAATR